MASSTPCCESARPDRPAPTDSAHSTDATLIHLPQPDANNAVLIASIASRVFSFAARPFGVRPRCWHALTMALLLALAQGARAEGVDLVGFDLTRSEDGLLLSYQTSFELPRAVEDAMQKGVPLYFEAEARLSRPRWYWFDKRVARVTRSWRLTWQPLTRRYRVNFGSLSQNYDTLADALSAIQRGTRWKVTELSELDDGPRQYLDFSFRLDTSQLPRPLQISFGGEADWALSLERRFAVPEAAAR
jgi:hypothetical protein